MNAKKILCLLSAGTMLTTAAPAFADPHRWEPRRDDRHAQTRVVVVHQAPVYYGPEPVYAGYGGNNALSTFGGAVIGAAIGSQIGRGSGNTAAIAIGAVVGGILGSGR